MDRGHVREELGAYVLGALELDERRSVESHVTDCGPCRDELAALSGMPGLLDRLTVEEVSAGFVAPLAPVRSERRGRSPSEEALWRRLRRWRWATAVAASVAVLGFLALVNPFAAPDTLPDPMVLELRPVASEATDVDGTVSAYAWDWGTTVEVDVEGLPRRSSYVLWAVSEDGERQSAGVWGPTPERAARVRGASAIQRDDLRTVEVRDGQGELLLATELPDG